MPADVGTHVRPAIGMRRIVVGVGSEPQAFDAARLADILAGSTGAGVTLATIQPLARGGLMPDGEAKVKARLRGLEASMAARTRAAVERDRSVAKGLSSVVGRERADLLVLGSSRHGPQGRVSIGARTRQFLAEANCPLAVAPRGLTSHAPPGLAVIGVGYDGSVGSREALSHAEWLAHAASARLRVRAVADDRLPYTGWTPTGDQGVDDLWDAAVEPNAEWLRTSAEAAVASDGADVVVEAGAGSPAEELTALSGEVDLLIIGSGRLGARLPRAEATAEEVMHRARCSVMLVPSRAPSPEAQVVTHNRLKQA